MATSDRLPHAHTLSSFGTKESRVFLYAVGLLLLSSSNATAV